MLKEPGSRTTQAASLLVGNELNQRQEMAKAVATRFEPWRLSSGARNALLVLHIIMGIGWMGVDMALLALLMTARTTDDAALVVSGFNAIRMIVPVTVPALSLGILLTGLFLGLGTRWGLIRYWWVLVKLLLSVVMTALVYLSLIPGINSIAPLSDTTLSADAVRASLGAIPTMLMFPPIVSFLMLGIATILSIYKPWRRTPWSRDRNASAIQDD